MIMLTRYLDTIWRDEMNENKETKPASEERYDLLIKYNATTTK
jgi:hypothetical protein